jgi:hypothetical protein
MNERIFYALVTAIIVLGGIGIGVAYHDSINATPSSPSGGAQAAAVEPYQLTLVITTQNYFNASASTQPAFYVLQNNTLQSSANIKLPSNVPIQLTIRNYDDGPANTSGIYSKVVGTYNDQVAVYNDTLIQSYAIDPTATSAAGIAITGGYATNYVNNTTISHTFTIFSNTTHNVVVNVPVLPSTVEQTTFMINQPGGYYWQCEAACGAGPDGMTGAMSTPGWMTGFVTVENMSVSNQPYNLNLLVVPGQPWNSTQTQPAYIVLNNGALYSSANISLPANTRIDVTIFNFDGYGPLADNTYANVSGTVGGKIFYLNDSMVNSTVTGSQASPTGISVSGGALLADIPLDQISHTFTIALGSGSTINIPVPDSATVSTSFYINQTGTFNWACWDACGFGTNGMEGAMSTAGWMMGSVYVY